MRVLLTYRDATFHPSAYIEALDKAGAKTTLRCFQRVDKPPFCIRDYDALLLAGGIDIDPVYFGQEKHEKTELEDGFDAFEFDILKEFMDCGKPVLGICRGIQVLAVALGGTLHQHLPDLPTVTNNHSGNEHPVIISPGSLLYDLFKTDRLIVNSRHHQAAATVPEHVNITARSDDGIIECIEYKNTFGVQWHPENLLDRMMPLFYGFVKGWDIYSG